MTKLKLPILESSLFMVSLESFAGTPLPGPHLPDFRLAPALQHSCFQVA